MGEQKPTIGRIVHYTNLGDKDGKYPPEIQAAVVTGVYSHGLDGPKEPPTHGQNDPEKLSLVKANKVGDVPNSSFADLTVFYRTGYFQTVCVPFSPEPKRGHWNWPPRV